MEDLENGKVHVQYTVEIGGGDPLKCRKTMHISSQMIRLMKEETNEVGGGSPTVVARDISESDAGVTRARSNSKCVFPGVTSYPKPEMPQL